MDSIVLQYSVPASILLCGEYFITHAHNSAICMALDRRACVTIRMQSSHPTRHAPTPHNMLQYDMHIESLYEHTTQKWTSLHECPLLSYAHALYEKYLTRYHLESTPLSSETWMTDIQSVQAVFDTRTFFSIDSHDSHQNPVHTKLGLGSSEAMAVLSCVFLLVMSNIDPFSCMSVLAEHARETHMRWQHNRGSGYGIYTSIFGGFGRYTTTHKPSWEVLHVPQDITWLLLKQDIHVSSAHAITIFEEWYAQDTHEAEKLSVDMQNHVRTYPNDGKSESLFRWLHVAKKLGSALGNAIGLSAEIHTATEHVLWKAVGAGNECAVGCVVKDAIDSSACASEKNIFPIDIGTGLRCDTI